MSSETTAYDGSFARDAPAPASNAQASDAAAAESVAVTVSADARKAFSSGDSAASKAAHDAQAASGTIAARSAEEKHGGAGSDFIKSIVFGGLDGVITTFSIVAAVSGASLPVQSAMLLGFSNLIADGISMGLGDFLSSKAELDFVHSEFKREKWEMDNYLEGEVAEMVALYTEKGVPKADAESILHTMAKYPDIFLSHMMQEELGLAPPDDAASPAKEGAVTFLSFLVFGSVPCWAYVITYGAGYTFAQGVFGIACAATALTMFALGAVQAAITRQNVLKSGILMLLNGSMAAAAAYLVGWGLERAIGNGVE